MLEIFQTKGDTEVLKWEIAHKLIGIIQHSRQEISSHWGRSLNYEEKNLRWHYGCVDFMWDRVPLSCLSIVRYAPFIPDHRLPPSQHEIVCFHHRINLSSASPPGSSEVVRMRKGWRCRTADAEKSSALISCISEVRESVWVTESFSFLVLDYLFFFFLLIWGPFFPERFSSCESVPCLTCKTFRERKREAECDGNRETFSDAGHKNLF